MLSLFIGIQYIGIIILLIEILYILKQKASWMQTYLLVIIFATLINFVGYLFEIQAGSKETALLAVKFLYIGKPYIILVTFLFVMKFYNVRIPDWLKNTMCALHISISMLVFTCDRHSLFYSSIDYTYDGYFPHLVLGHSPIYKIYSGIVLVYLLILTAAGIHRYHITTTTREKKQIWYLTAIAIVSGTGFVVYFSGIMKGYDCTLLGYLVSTVLLLIIMLRYNLLDTVDLAKEHIVDEFADGVLVTDKNGRILYFNPQIKNIYPEFDKENGAGTLEELEQLYLDKQQLFVNDHTYEIHKKDIVKNAEVYGKMLVIRDITDIYSYTIQLENASQAKSDFLAKMSHEIRTPINAVLGMNEMILRESADKETKKYAMDIKTSANALLSLINDILDTSKIESGKLEIIPAEYALDSLLNDVVNMIYIKTKEKELEFLLKVDETIPNFLFGDDIRIRQILVNLLNNAVKYTDKGSITLKVSAAEKNDGINLHFEVIDTGKGIKEEDLPKLYAAFERIEEDKNRNVEGTGLGMKIVVDLLDMMESSLKVESEYGKGTSFSFTLYQSVTDRQPIGNFEERSENLYQEETYTASFLAPEAKVLVVDDNEINRRVFKGLLKQTLVQITEASSGFECMELIQEERFDIIFMDHMMPELDGIETLHRMGKLADNKCVGVPVIILTANAVVGAKEKYLEEGFDDYLSKPVQGTKLENMLKRYLPKELYRLNPALADLQGTDDAAETAGEIPEMQEFDVNYAKLFFENDDLLLMTMQDVYN
ncbi:MAG: ATP-binding protein, partial [Alistipes sp.]|nr:ATP-binding protein [Alistipes sp.]